MVNRTVLYNRQPQAGPSDLPGMALVHPVEPLENPFLVLVRDADAIILHRQNRMSVLYAGGNDDITVRFIILDSIIAQIEYPAI